MWECILLVLNVSLNCIYAVGWLRLWVVHKNTNTGREAVRGENGQSSFILF